jgi:hypothetical protein
VRARGAAAVLALALASLSATGRAYADGAETDKQIAQQLFDEGRALMDKERFAEACPKLAESQRLDPGGGTLLNLALCHEREGKTATAWAEFGDALAQAVKDARKDRETFAREHIDALEPKLVRIVVSVPPEVRGLLPDVMLDRSTLAAPAWGSAIPVDPGEHRVTAAVAGRAPWSKVVSATSAGSTYAVDVGLTEAAPPRPACAPGQALVNGACVSPAAPPEVGEGGGKRSTAFWVVLGSAGVFAAASVVTGLVALNADAYVKDNCSAARDFCWANDADAAATRATTTAWLSTGSLILAAGLGVTAFVLPRTKPKPARVQVGLGSLRITWM